MNTQLQRGSLADYQKGGDLSGMVFTFKIIEQNLNPSMSSSNGKPVRNRSIDRIEAFDLIREKGKDGRIVQKTIRYIEGEPSIYKDEQSPDKDIPKKKHYLEFPRGIKVVSGADNLLLKFIPCFMIKMFNNIFYNITNRI